MNYLPKASYKWLYREYRKAMQAEFQGDSKPMAKLWNQANHEGWYKTLSALRNIYFTSPVRQNEQYYHETSDYVFFILARK